MRRARPALQAHCLSNMRVAVALAAVGDQTADFRKQIMPFGKSDKNRPGRASTSPLIAA